MEVTDSVVSALRTVAFVVGAIIADESIRFLDVILANLFLNSDRLDLSVFLENFAKGVSVP
jgi:hypothetical protein